MAFVSRPRARPLLLDTAACAGMISISKLGQALAVELRLTAKRAAAPVEEEQACETRECCTEEC